MCCFTLESSADRLHVFAAAAEGLSNAPKISLFATLGSNYHVLGAVSGMLLRQWSKTMKLESSMALDVDGGRNVR